MRTITGLISKYSLDHNDALLRAHGMFRENSLRLNGLRVSLKSLARETRRVAKRFKAYLRCYKSAAERQDADTAFNCLNAGINKFLSKSILHLKLSIYFASL